MNTLEYKYSGIVYIVKVVLKIQVIMNAFDRIFNICINIQLLEKNICSIQIRKKCVAKILAWDILLYITFEKGTNYYFKWLKKIPEHISKCIRTTFC